MNGTLLNKSAMTGRWRFLTAADSTKGQQRRLKAREEDGLAGVHLGELSVSKCYQPIVTRLAMGTSTRIASVKWKM